MTSLKVEALAKKIEKKCIELFGDNQNKSKILIHSPGLWAIFLKLKNTQLVVHSIPTLVATRAWIFTKEFVKN